MTDTIFLEGLEIQMILGIQDWEREVRQTVRVDLEMPADARKAAERDHIDATLNYKSVAKRIIAYGVYDGFFPRDPAKPASGAPEEIAPTVTGTVAS